MVFSLCLHLSQPRNTVFGGSFRSHVSRDRGCHELGIMAHMHVTLSLLVHVGHPLLLETFYRRSELAPIFIDSTVIKVLFIRAQTVKTSISLLKGDGTIAKVLL